MQVLGSALSEQGAPGDLPLNVPQLSGYPFLAAVNAMAVWSLQECSLEVLEWGTWNGGTLK